MLVSLTVWKRRWMRRVSEVPHHYLFETSLGCKVQTRVALVFEVRVL